MSPLDSSEALGRLMAVCETSGQREALRAISSQLDELSEVARRAQRMLDHGTPLSHLFAATVLGVEPQPLRVRGSVRPDGTELSAGPSPAHIEATARTKALAQVAIDQVCTERAGEVVAAWRELIEHNPDARHLGGELSARLWAALDLLAAQVVPS